MPTSPLRGCEKTEVRQQKNWSTGIPTRAWFHPRPRAYICMRCIWLDVFRPALPWSIPTKLHFSELANKIHLFWVVAPKKPCRFGSLNLQRHLSRHVGLTSKICKCFTERFIFGRNHNPSSQKEINPVFFGWENLARPKMRPLHQSWPSITPQLLSRQETANSVKNTD